MTTVLENALTATTIDSGHLQPALVVVSLIEMVTEVLDRLEFVTSQVIDVSELEDAYVRVDRSHLTQVLTNLLTNAAKYGGDRIAISSRTERSLVVVSIADNGPGVDTEFIPHLFDRYSRSLSVRSSRLRGSGLGLYIVRDLLALNGGAIHYAPSAIGGAEFLIELRRAIPVPVGDPTRAIPFLEVPAKELPLAAD